MKSPATAVVSAGATLVSSAAAAGGRGESDTGASAEVTVVHEAIINEMA